MSDAATKVRAASAVRRQRSRPGLLIPAAGIAVLLVMPLVGGLAAVITTAPTVVFLVAIYVPVVATMARGEADIRLARAIWLGLVAKLVGIAIRYLVISGVYGAGDSRGYDQAGAVLAQFYRHGLFSVPVPGQARGAGTIALRVIVGIIYSATGSGLLIGAVVFGLLSFTGAVLCVKAFRLAVPGGDHVRYARLVLLLPSMFFWPSSIGKDAWMLFGLGILANGAARLYTRSFGGLVLTATGTVAMAIVRPHIALVAFGAAVVALVFRRAGAGGRRRMNLVGKVVVLVPLSFACLLLLTKAQTFLKVDDLSVEGVQAAGAQAGERSSQGGSAFKPVAVKSPAQLPLATVTVLFRPFPFEASNVLALGIASEGFFLFLFAAVAWRRVLAGLGLLGSNPFLVLCGVYTLGFIVAFSNIANFGILARERVQVFPFFFAFLAAVPNRRLRGRGSEAVTPRGASGPADQVLAELGPIG